MSKYCTSCLVTRDFSFFQPRVATTDESKLLRTCSVCRENNRRSRQRRAPLTELNANTTTIGRRPRKNDDQVLPVAVRQRRNNLPLPNHLPSNPLPSNPLPPNLPPLNPLFLNPLPPDLPPPDLPPSNPPPPNLPPFNPPPPDLLPLNLLPLNLPPPNPPPPDLPPPDLPPPDLPSNLLPPNVPLPGPNPRRRRLSVDSNASCQREYGFNNSHLVLNSASVPLAFHHPANAVHCTRRLDLGSMSIVCSHCQALHWLSERLRTSALSATDAFEACCKKGSVVLTNFQAPPRVLQQVLEGTGPQEKHFRQHIRRYNAALTFTSMGCRGEQRATTEGPNSFQVHGEVYHMQGPLDANAADDARYAQLFFYDPAYAADLRHHRNPELDRMVLGDLSQMLEDVNPYVGVYRTARERLHAEQPNTNARLLLNPQLRLVMEEGADRRRHNLPTADEVAVILVGEETEQRTRRDIQLQTRGTAENPSGCVFIDQNHVAYMPLHYVLLFPHGDGGWHWGMELQDPHRQRERVWLNQRAFHRYHLHPRPGQFNALFRCQRLFQQYIVDAWAVADQNKLNWVREHQDEIRAEVYNGLVDSLTDNDVSSERIGRRVVLPSSYTGGDRYMQQRYQNAMAINRHLHKPTLFITMTANPKWLEITRELLPGQDALDRPDLVACVFHLKVQFLLNDLKKDQIFGRYAGSVYTIEYQKRGLPHMHLLLFLHPEDRLRYRDPAVIDQVVSAEFPTQAEDPDGKLFDLMSSTMIHGPCGEFNPKASCMVKVNQRMVCSKQFPKAHQEATVVQENGYPFYRRRLNRRTHSIRDRRFPDAALAVTNQWVVPYNRYLSRRYRAHINVECCASVKVIKYIHKYVYKGSDLATVAMNMRTDEVARHLQGRYIGPTEGMWRLFEFPMHEEFPPVQELTVHLPGDQVVYFNPQLPPDELREKMDNARSTLMAFFDYNCRHADGRQWLYQEFPAHYVYDRRSRSWHPRKQQTAIGRMYHCNPMAGEKFYLRLLLTAVKGPQSFEHIRTVNGVRLETFREACVALSLTRDDQQWFHTFREVSSYASGESMRRLLITAMIADLGDARRLWEEFREHLCDNLLHRMQRYTAPPSDMDHPEWDLGLFLIDEHLQQRGRSAAQFHLPPFQHAWRPISRNHLIANELDYDLHHQAELRDQRYAQLNADQKHCFDTIVATVADNPQHAHFFLQGAGGTGKTFLYQALCNYYRAQGQIVLCVASSGVAAELLPGGRTSHSRFQISLVLHENSMTMINAGSHAADLIRRAALIIWDEVPMQHKNCFDAVHRTLCDIRQDHEHTFGGLPAILGGDWAQILPVVRHGNRASIVRACFQNSFLWLRFRMLTLQINMRLHADTTGHNQQYAQWLSQLSYDPALQDQISLPEYVNRVSELDDLYEKVFPRSELHNHQSPDFWRSRAILTPFNDSVVSINMELLRRFVGNECVFFSEDSADYGDDDGYEMSVESLQQLECAGLPSSKLSLKLGAPAMLLRNLDQFDGLNNGSRMIITRIGHYCLQGRLLGGDHDGELRLIPKIPLTSLEEDFPFTLTRRQFPLRLCFAMTINKSQGQTLDTVGVDLQVPVFCHGQLYVALSRATDVAKLTVLLPEGQDQTANVVYPEVLQEVLQPRPWLVPQPLQPAVNLELEGLIHDVESGVEEWGF